MCSVLDIKFVVYFVKKIFRSNIFNFEIYFTTVVGDNNKYNEDEFQFQFLINIKLLNSLDTQKHGNKEKLSIKKASL